MDEKEALEYAANVLDAVALMGYGSPTGDRNRDEGFRSAVGRLRDAAGRPEWRRALEQQGGFGDFGDDARPLERRDA